MWDLTCADTFAASHVANCALIPAHAANQAERLKTEKYRNLADRYIFQPVSVETAGVFGSSTKLFLAELGRRMTEETGDAREETWLKQRLSIAVVRENAYCIIASARRLNDLNA